MKKIQVHTLTKKISADLLTPVGIYLKIRDKYSEPLLLESSDYHSGKNSKSFICFEPLASIIVRKNELIIKQKRSTVTKSATASLSGQIEDFMQGFDMENKKQALFGFTSYEAVQLMEDISLAKKTPDTEIPLAVYSLYKNIIVINHFNDEVEITCNAENENELGAQLAEIENLLANKTITEFSFSAHGEEGSDITDESYLELVKKAKQHCKLGDVFQLVLSRRFSQGFTGDEFNVYRQLRRVNPSP